MAPQEKDFIYQYLDELKMRLKIAETDLDFALKTIDKHLIFTKKDLFELLVQIVASIGTTLLILYLAGAI